MSRDSKPASEGAVCLDCNQPAVKTSVWPSGGETHYCAMHATFPSARVLLAEGVAVRVSKRGWSIYPELTYGCEPSGRYTVYPGTEGPQEGLTLDEALKAVGGDCTVFLAPAGRIRWADLDRETQARLLRGESRPTTPRTECSTLDDARVLDDAARVLRARGRDNAADLIQAECDRVLRELL